MDAFAERYRTLAEAWGWWATTLGDLETAAWRLDTRLPGWDVAALAAHTTLLVRGLRFMTSQPLDDEPVIRSAADMLNRFNAPGGAATTLADRSRRSPASKRRRCRMTNSSPCSP